MRKILFSCLALLCSTIHVFSQNNPDPNAPELEYVCELRVTCSQAYSVGPTAHGDRVIIPITGGTFEGPKMKGIILSGGADYQLVDSQKGRNEVEAIYTIKTDDGVHIHIRNCGLICTNEDKNGQPDFYFRTAPKFEAPNNSKYDWLNNSIFICVPSIAQGYISLKVWRVL